MIYQHPFESDCFYVAEANILSICGMDGKMRNFLHPSFCGNGKKCEIRLHA